MKEKENDTLATFGGGCFWCTEAVLGSLRGVIRAVCGYSGGHAENPTYQEVCTGATGHAECVQITFDPGVISYQELLEVFWKTHDPTTRNRQGNDIGTQYRSVIFYHDLQQKDLAESCRDKLEAERAWDRPLVTEIVPLEKFWPAESYHQDYFRNNPSNTYCSLVVAPKIEKFKKVFRDRLKKP
ncbi:MAG: peptide-methionine (S)-S-oxide reductase MsrA [Acidobacteria bacterium]|nr:peptide-methionine (S)-S-oxide reductase MsrA [Acidobacteriota bacterium]